MIHVCLFDKECCSYGAARRIYLNLLGWRIIVGEKSQGWRPAIGATQRWHWITAHPAGRWQCKKNLDSLNFPDAYCGRLRHHTGQCFDWTSNYRRLTR